MRDDFAVFILTHGRANNVITYKTLQSLGYNGKTYFIIDNEDDQADLYIKNFGKENVIIFDKLKKSKEFDTVDTNDNRKSIVYARNASFDIAKDLGLKYFLELDDDYDSFIGRCQKGEELGSFKIKDINKLFEDMIVFLEKSKALTVAFAQGGDFIGGIGSKVWKEQISRKAMNSFFCKTENKFDFIGRINEDVNSYVLNGIQGNLMFTIAKVMINQGQTQSNSGGMTDLYLESGTYIKSFFTVIVAPSAVKISTMGNKFRRFHHKINSDRAYPKILSEKIKK